MDLGKAFIISLVSHCALVMPLAGSKLLLPEPKITEMHVTYHYVKPAPAPQLKKIPDTLKFVESPRPLPQPVSEKRVPRPEGPITITSTVKENVTAPMPALPLEKTKPSHAQKPAPPRPKQQMSAPIPAQHSESESIPGTTLPKTPEGIEYDNYIREAIRLFIEKNYKPEHKEGDVSVTFVLSKSGELISLRIIENKSVNDPVLHRLAYNGIKSSSPFQSFPRSISVPQISYNLTIVFKQK